MRCRRHYVSQPSNARHYMPRSSLYFPLNFFVIAECLQNYHCFLYHIVTRLVATILACCADYTSLMSEILYKCEVFPLHMMRVDLGLSAITAAIPRRRQPRRDRQVACFQKSASPARCRDASVISPTPGFAASLAFRFVMHA